MEDGPRYRIVPVSPNYLEDDLKANLRPGDRIVSVFPTRLGSHGSDSDRLCLVALLELRHPSWAAEKVGWLAGEQPDPEAL